jgi:hypothetical protein
MEDKTLGATEVLREPAGCTDRRGSHGRHAVWMRDTTRLLSIVRLDLLCSGVL